MFKKWIKEYILKNKYDLMVILIMLLIGILVGIGVYIFSESTSKEMLIKKATEIFTVSLSNEYLETNVVPNGIKTNIIIVVVLAISSVTLFGRYIIEMLAVVKGAMLGIYSLILFNVFGFGYGIIAVLLLVVLVNVIYIPAYVFLSVMFMEIHFNIFKTRMNGITGVEILKYITKTAMLFVVMISSMIVEQVASLMALRLFFKLG